MPAQAILAPDPLKGLTKASTMVMDRTGAPKMT